MPDCARRPASSGSPGSVGKTGTKEALRLALEAQADGAGRTFATTGNLNNHWGVPLSLARMPADSRYGVFELGMNHAGEIAPLSRLVKPDVSIITTVEAVHIENFDSVEGIADAKAEIFAGMGPGGVAVLNRDNPHFSRVWSPMPGPRASAGSGASESMPTPTPGWSTARCTRRRARSTR